LSMRWVKDSAQHRPGDCNGEYGFYGDEYRTKK